MFSDGHIVKYRRVFMKCGYTDLRCGIESLKVQLSTFHQTYFTDDADDNALYLFCGKSCKKVKGLIHMKEGFVLVNILLDTDRVKWIRNSCELREITEDQLNKIIHGESIV